MSTTDQEEPFYVLTIEAVRWGIEALTARRVHQFFLAYLYLRKLAVAAGTMSGIQPSWAELRPHLRVGGGPPGKPFFRPMSDVRVKDASGYWLNRNLAGSWAPGSLRTVPRTVVDTVGSSFTLRPNHAQLALQNLLFNEPLPALAFATFWYRDFGFIPDRAGPLSPLELAGTFAQDFNFSPADNDYDTLFSTDTPPGVTNWFEPTGTSAVGAA